MRFAKVSVRHMALLSMGQNTPLRACFELRLRKDVPNDIRALNFSLAVQNTANHLMRQNTDIVWPETNATGKIRSMVVSIWNRHG